jgi:hypothetical protein
MLMCLEQSVYAFQWAMENFCKEDDNVVIYHVHHSVLTPVSTLATGAYHDQPSPSTVVGTRTLLKML